MTGVVSAVVFHIFFPLRIFDQTWIGYATGWLTLVLGVLLASWAVIEAGAIDTAAPTKLITTGPYRRSRNPMYIAWTAVGLGIALTINTMWLMLFLPIVVLYTHFFIILREEKNLEQEFGDEYRQYSQSVRRYF